MKAVRHIFAAVAALTLLASCSRDESEVIPRGKLSEIYAEMLMTDQWITSTPGFRHIADTSLVYLSLRSMDMIRRIIEKLWMSTWMIRRDFRGY